MIESIKLTRDEKPEDFDEVSMIFNAMVIDLCHEKGLDETCLLNLMLTTLTRICAQSQFPHRKIKSITNGLEKYEKGSAFEKLIEFYRRKSVELTDGDE